MTADVYIPMAEMAPSNQGMLEAVSVAVEEFEEPLPWLWAEVTGGDPHDPATPWVGVSLLAVSIKRPGRGVSGVPLDCAMTGTEVMDGGVVICELSVPVGVQFKEIGSSGGVGMLAGKGLAMPSARKEGNCS